MRHRSTTIVLLGLCWPVAATALPASATRFPPPPAAKSEATHRDTAAAQPDDAQAVEALRSLQADLKRDREGFVVEAKLMAPPVTIRPSCT